MENTPRMRNPALAASVAVLLGLLGANADALSLGRLTVQSALGQPLRAEIEIPEINAEEVDTLKGSVASADAFKAAGLEYNAALNNLQVSLQRRPDGRMVLKLSSDRPVSEPFVDLILEANWASGRILRDYTLLFDPPSLREPVAVAPTAPQVAAAPVRQAAAPAPAREVQPTAPAPTPKPAAQRTTAAPAPAPAVKAAAAAAKGSQVTVRPGDTASKIAGQHKPASVSLDQMLVALLRANPEAFAGSNINRLKSGAVLDLPSSDVAGTTPRDEATRTVLAQSKDFNEFRRQLAGAAPTTASTATERQASGKVRAQVEEKKAPTTAPDKLTLSKAQPAAKAADAKLAADRQAKEAAAREAELAKNIADLNKLKAAAPIAVAKAPAASTPAIPAAPPASAAKAEVKPAIAIPAQPVPAPVASAVAPKASAPAARASAAKPVEEPGFVDGLIADPLIPAGTLGILALLGGFAVYRSRQGKKSGQGDSSFLDSHLQPDSFFGASGGEQVDTSNETTATGSSMIYSPSQLDAGGEVDPVAEADVYLAYGRDQQAEDILKDALQAAPTRLAIHAKLADIYAKRTDAQALNALATIAYAVSQGQGPEWDHIRELGVELDKGNALYQLDGPGAAPPDLADEVQTPALTAAPVDLDLDFDLDFEPQITPEPEAAQSSLMGVLHESDVAGASDEPIELFSAPEATASAPIEPDFSVTSSTMGLEAKPAPQPDLLLPELPALSEQTTPLKVKSQIASSPEVSPEMLSFDLGSLSLDLNTETPAAPAPPAEAAAEPDTDNLDPLSTKLALAREFQSIGDNDGAHALAEEVYSLASGDLRAEAKRFLSELGFAQSGFSTSTF